MTTIIHRHERRPRTKLRPLDPEQFPRGTRSDFFVRLFDTASSGPVDVPFIVARGAKPGPIVGITAAIHGNELNGIRIIHNVIEELDYSTMAGTLIGVPVVNMPALHNGVRRFPDGLDLNHTFPGKSAGRSAEQYARAFTTVFLGPCNYLIDIHTASAGRLNTMYVRADLFNETARRMAELMNPEIILHIAGGDGTLRNTARQKGIPAITVEAGNPSVFQGRFIYEGETGIRNILIDLGLIRGEIELTREPVICKSSRWLRTTSGGLLDIRFDLAERVSRKQLLARTLDTFGYELAQFSAPFDGVVIGRAQYPVAIQGTRFCHLGQVGTPEPGQPGGSPLFEGEEP